MIKWCAYCQQFQGELPPFDNYSITHGICQSCALKGLDISDHQFSRLKILADIQKKLFQAGVDGTEALAKEAIAEAKLAGVQSVDLLVGVIAPLLWKVGDLWESGKITVADEHRFTAVYDAIVAEIEDIEPSYERVDVLLLNGPGNTHQLGLRVLNLWLHSKKIKSAILKNSELESAVSEIVRKKPRFLGFSVATKGQLKATLELGEKIKERLEPGSLPIIIGGGAIRRGNFKNFSGTSYMSDIHEFLSVLESNRRVQQS